jgi:hypothetical protein
MHRFRAKKKKKIDLMFQWRDRFNVGSAGLKPGATNVVAPSGLEHFAKFVRPAVR